jgi:hypothetical protein
MPYQGKTLLLIGGHSLVKEKISAVNMAPGVYSLIISLVGFIPKANFEVNLPNLE